MCAFAGRFHLHVLHELAPESRKSNLIKVPPVLFMALQRWGGSRKHFCSKASSCSFFSNHHYFLTIWGEVWRNDAHSACVLHIREWVCVCARTYLYVYLHVRLCECASAGILERKNVCLCARVRVRALTCIWPCAICVCDYARACLHLRVWKRVRGKRKIWRESVHACAWQW